jgi:glycosyltransferase involved in cell wall biosynthesis
LETNDSAETISIVCPIYNEEDVLPLLIKRLAAVLEQIPLRCEVILVNDGSHDKSLLMLREIAANHPWARVVSLSRNFGHQTAVSAGLSNTSGSAVVVMDADLQDPPELVVKMVELWKAGNQVVYCVRRKRKEGLLKRTCYAAFYRLMRAMVDMDIPLDAGDFCLMDRRVVDLICAMPERNRFIRGLRTWVGFRQVALEYERDARQAGEPKYNMRRLIKLATDGIFSFSYIPLKLSGTLGLVVAACSALYAAKLIVWSIYFHNSIPGFATLAVGMLMFGSIQLFVLYFIGEYLGRIYDEVKQRPTFIVQERIGFVEKKGVETPL